MARGNPQRPALPGAVVRPPLLAHDSLTHFPTACVPSTPSSSPRWWQWPTILSLDAPVVVLLWQWLFARVAGTPLDWARPFVLGASVWLAYAADRWIEGWRLTPDQTRTQRHRFYQRHRWPVALGWTTVLAVDLAVAFSALTTREFRFGLLLLSFVLIYLLSHQLVHRGRRWRAPKEVLVATLLTGGVALFPLAQHPPSAQALAAPLGLFALLCFANCALIAAWEFEIDETHGQTSFSHQFVHGQVVGRTLPWMLVLLGALAALVEHDSARTAALCATMSAIFLGLVDRIEPRIGWAAARVLADAALLTPLVPLLAAAFFSS